MSNEMTQAIDTVLELAQKRKVQMDVLAVDRSSTRIGFQQRKMENFSFSETRQLGVRVLDGQYEGVAYTESLDPDSLNLMFDDALANAKRIRREWISKLPSTSQFKDVAGLYDDSIMGVTPEQKIKAAEALEAAAIALDKRISVPHAIYGDGTAEIHVGNTNGLRGSYRTNSIFAYSNCLAQDAGGPVMANQYEVLRNFGSLNTELIARQAAEKTLARLGAKRPTTGMYTVVFQSRVAEILVGIIGDYFSAKSVDERTSPLAGKVGQKIFSANMNITDDPFSKLGSGGRPFDEEGYASIKTTLVENGVLRGYLTNSVMAQKMKLPHTASASRSPASDLDVSSSNLVVTPGKESFEQMLGADKKVLLITDVLGMAGVRATSGDFSLPVEGYLYENGKHVCALKDFLISGNILQLFSAVEAVGQMDSAPTGNTICPSLLVRDLNVSGQS